MSKYVLLGLEGESRMFMVDCEGMTVDEIDPADLGGVPLGEHDMLQVASARDADEPLVRGVSVAVASMRQSAAASFPFTASFPFNESA